MEAVTKKGSSSAEANKKAQPPKKKEAPKAKEGAAKAEDASKKKKQEIRLKKEFINPTPKGEKKDMTTPMIAAYDPPTVEAAWYDWWEKQGYFHADNADTTREKFVMVIPPPNVTGSLHMGHALTNSVEDALSRWHRMSGKNVLWVPGIDHAGIATQVVVEKKIAREQQKSRHDLGRENFIKEVWKWKDEYGDRIKMQLRRMGSSVDWEREAFTMDEKLSVAVTEAFVRMFEEGLIYRGTRLVNWCSTLKTAISDIEVNKKDLPGRTLKEVPGHPEGKKYPFGILVSFAYPVEGSGEKLVISTTRIETMLGDTAVAVHPEDKRYTHLHGKNVIHPFNGRKIPIICDPELVDMSFGTGVVKVTPAHDPNDYLCGKRHNLEFINILNEDGSINENGGEFQGMKRFEAREAVLKALQDKGLYEGEKDNPMVLPICSRTGDIIEPMLKPQWWVRCKEMGEEAVRVVKEKELKIVPERHEITWFRWLENAQDWCISRQLWWGHRIPAYLVSIEGQPAPDPEDQNNWVAARNEEEAMAKAKAKHPDIPESKLSLSQDPDVLDTWFSSGLFPFSTMGWPNTEHPDFKAFYPTSILETGHDILFFWVARMVMMGMKLTGKLPFNTVLLHAMVRDAHGRKMSKSLGNVIDPLDVTEGITLEQLHGKLYNGNLDPKEIDKAIEGQKEDFPNGISECGTDAMRFALCAYTSQGRSINLDINRVVAYRNFCNKLWNATKFALMNLGEGFQPNPSAETSGKESLMEQWILSRLHHAAKESDTGFNTFDLGQATNAIYAFWLYDLCDVFLEAIKPTMRLEEGAPERRSCQDTLYTCLEQGLRLLHPFMPFVSEELYQRLPRRPGDNIESIMISPYPHPNTTSKWHNSELEETVKLSQEIIRAGRGLRSNYNLSPALRPSYFLRLRTEELRKSLAEFVPIMVTLTNAATITILSGEEEPPSGCSVNIVNENCEIHLMIKGLVDPVAELKKLEKNLQKTNQQLSGLVKRMNAPQYRDKVPENVQKDNEERVVKLQQEVKTIEEAIEKFTKLKEEEAAAK